jgi:hypothetical protein
MEVGCGESRFGGIGDNVCGETNREARQDRNLRGGRSRQGRQRAGCADLKDGVNAIAAAAFGDIKRLVEDRLAAEIVVLAGFVGSVGRGAVLCAGQRMNQEG